MLARRAGTSKSIVSCYDKAGRTTWISSQLTSDNCRNQVGPTSTTQAYASGITYKPHGAVHQMALGNGLWEYTDYNVRLQAFDFRLGSAAQASNVWALTNDYGTTGNNGNVVKQTLTVPSTKVNSPTL